MSPSDFAELKVLAQLDAERRQADRAFELAGCVGKDRFSSYENAQAAQSRMRRRHQGAARASIYACRHCGGWHMGRGK